VNPLKRSVAALLARTRLSSLGFAIQRAVLSPFIRVVYYHDVPAAMSEAFTRQMLLFKQMFVPASSEDLSRLLATGEWPHARPGIIVTFDDGLRSHAEVVAPILDRLGFQGWFFVPIELTTMAAARQPEGANRHGVIHYCDTSADPRIFMTESQLVGLNERHVVGCHTASHVRLSRDLSENELRVEINVAKQSLESVLGREVDAFSWVGGEEWAYSESAARSIAGLFEYAFTTNTSITRAGSSGLLINRTHVEASFPLDLVRLQLSGMMDLYYRPKRRRLEANLSVCNDVRSQAIR
jgi:peptidoglycan/xylan/chitin deacetylase (PgdA/CDA1 family)